MTESRSISVAVSAMASYCLGRWWPSVMWSAGLGAFQNELAIAGAEKSYEGVEKRMGVEIQVTR